MLSLLFAAVVSTEPAYIPPYAPDSSCDKCPYIDSCSRCNGCGCQAACDACLEDNGYFSKKGGGCGDDTTTSDDIFDIYGDEYDVMPIPEELMINAA